MQNKVNTVIDKVLNNMDTKQNDTVRSRKGERYTENELMVRLKFFIGCCLALTLIGIVFTVLYSIMFVTQPLNAISPIDQKFFELIIPVATFLCGTLSGIMLAGTGKEAAMAGAAAQRAADKDAKDAKDKEDVKK
jgi:hypothetical protein